MTEEILLVHTGVAEARIFAAARIFVLPHRFSVNPAQMRR